MDFLDDHTAFGTASADDVSPMDEVDPMYVPGADDHGIGGDPHPEGTDPTGSTAPAGSHGTVSVDVGGHEVTAEATLDVDHDGQADTAIVTDSAGDHIAITDTDGDGEADHAALLDDSGRVVDTAHLDPSGTWVQDGPGDSNPYGDTGTPIGSGGPGDSTGDSTGSSGGPGSGSPGGSGGQAGGDTGSHPITVEVGGHAVEAQATVDSDHDGTSDTAVVQTPDGNRITFTDTNGDGHADRATVYDSQGRLVGTARYDESSGTWIEGSGTGGSVQGGAGATTTVAGTIGTTTAGPGAAGGIGGDSTGTGGSDSAGDAGSATAGSAGGIGTSPAGGTGSVGGEHIDVHTGGQSAQVEADYDLNHDGRDETAVVHGSDGTTIAFSDTDGDGDADRAAVYDADGRLVGMATYHEDSGTWVQDRS